MGLLFLFLLGIAAIIVVAKLASKVRPENERLIEKKEEAKGKKRHKDEVYSPEDKVDALITVLIKNKLLSEEELLEAIRGLKKEKGEYEI